MGWAGRLRQLAVVAGTVIAAATGAVGLLLYVVPPGRALPLWGALGAGCGSVAVVWGARRSDRVRAAWSRWPGAGVTFVSVAVLQVQVVLLPVVGSVEIAIVLGGMTWIVVLCIGMCDLLQMLTNRSDGAVGALVAGVVLVVVVWVPSVTAPIVDAGIRARLDLVEDRYLADAADGRVDESPGYAASGPTFEWDWAAVGIGDSIGVLLDRSPQARRTHRTRSSQCHHLRDDWYWCRFD
jgi:hypothetical protein